MSRVRSLWFLFVFVLLACNSVQSKQCDWSDERCLTIAANNIYNVVTKGIPGRFESVDPLYKEQIVGDMGDLHYKVTNVTMSGLRHCKVEYWKYNVTDELRYKYDLHCPKLVYDFHYDCQGTFNGLYYDHTGEGTATADDVVIILKGKSETYISEKDHKEHLVLKEYQEETELRGRYTFENKKLIKGDQVKFDSAVSYLNLVTNLKNKPAKLQTLKYFLELFMQTVNTYLEDIPLEDALSEDYKHPY